MRTRTQRVHNIQTGEITEIQVPIPDEPETPYQELRRAAYQQAFTLDDLMEALFEQAEGRPEKLQALQAKRAAIKAQFPKSV